MHQHDASTLLLGKPLASIVLGGIWPFALPYPMPSLNPSKFPRPNLHPLVPRQCPVHAILPGTEAGDR